MNLFTIIILFVVIIVGCSICYEAINTVDNSTKLERQRHKNQRDMLEWLLNQLDNPELTVCERAEYTEAVHNILQKIMNE